MWYQNFFNPTLTVVLFIASIFVLFMALVALRFFSQGFFSHLWWLRVFKYSALSETPPSVFKMEPVKKYRIYLLTLNASMAHLSFGTCVGWSSPTVPKLRDHTDDSPLSRPITLEEEGWISSIMTLSAFACSFIAGYVAHWIGRKWTLLFSGALVTVSYILMLVAQSVWTILAARMLQGLAGGFFLAALPMFIGEVAPSDSRGGVGSLMTLLMIVGILYTYIIGPYVSYMVLQWCCLAVSLPFLFTFVFNPDSPYFYVIKGRMDDAKKSLQFYRGQSADGVEDELSQIQKAVEESMANRGTFLDIFRNRGCRKAIFIICSLLFLQQLSGTTAVTFNGQSIFASAKSTLDPAIATIILALVQLLANSVTPFVVDWSGRRIVLMISSVGMCLALFALGTFFYIQTFGDASAILWIPIPALILFNLMYSFGFGPVPYVILGEIFPSNVKPTAMSLAAAVAWISSFLVTRWFPQLNALGTYYSFWIFGSCCVLSLLFVIFILIETKGLSVQHIQEKLHRT